MNSTNIPSSEKEKSENKILPLYLDTQLIEHIGDLYYNTLADLIGAIANVKDYYELHHASNKIRQAWDISEKYINKEKPPFKHEHAEKIIKDLGGIPELIARFEKEDRDGQKIFLLQLSYKIRFDAEQDAQRPSIDAHGIADATRKRTKLATALFEASLAIKQVYLNT